MLFALGRSRRDAEQIELRREADDKSLEKVRLCTELLEIRERAPVADTLRLCFARRSTIRERRKEEGESVARDVGRCRRGDG